MENAEEIFHFLEDFSKCERKTIPQELNDYLAYVARTGDPVYQWSLVKSLFKEKLLNVITDFYETTPGIEIPPYPNVNAFNYDSMKNSLVERLDSFNSAPFTVQRICELLTYPRKQYNRVDKFMRAIEKNILVVSTREPGHQRHPENGEPIVNGSDNNSDYNVDVEMEDMSWKDNPESRQNCEPQPSSSEAHIIVEDIETRLHTKKDAIVNSEEKSTTQYASESPSDLNANEEMLDNAPKPKPLDNAVASTSDDIKNNNTEEQPSVVKVDEEMKSEAPNEVLVIPEIKVDDAEMTEQKLVESKESETLDSVASKENTQNVIDNPTSMDDSSSDSIPKEEDNKIHCEVSSSSEESSSSSDIIDGNSNSPKTEEQIDIHVEHPPQAMPENPVPEQDKEDDKPMEDAKPVETDKETPTLEAENYSISDVNSELPVTNIPDSEKTPVEAEVKEVSDKKKEDPSPDNTENLTNTKVSDT
ncbi:hypothetical protein KGM_206603 [Danaus plexippus plexippus]|uniref:Serine/threonine-protein phosphatase 4 regulatory subunit 2 n=1 Tax=Danaus plexippus plexippus TaxID=278856 RepID=A0A212EU67_DANPL|nr:hypothetical protein KGM_206603 [Danaus plexippus plexippus]